MTPVSKNNITEAFCAQLCAKTNAKNAKGVKLVQAAIKLAPEDNVAIAIRDIATGEVISIDGSNHELKEGIKRGHKFSLYPIAANKNIIKYGFAIGHATQDIDAGAHIHSHNCVTNLEKEFSRFEYIRPNQPDIQLTTEGFMGYPRQEGGFGIRNEIWLIPTVGCVSALCDRLATQFNKQNYPNIDGIFALKHQFGCSQLGDDLGQTRDIIASLACHPNCGGVLIIGLGCENNRLANLIETIDEKYQYKLRAFEAQKVGDEFETGAKMLEELAAITTQHKRIRAPISELVIGVKCGGSDGLSGLTANPLIGRIAKRMCDIGASVLMTEIPEMFGAEKLLYQKCESKSIFEKLEQLIESFKKYFSDHGQKIYENPSPGNKDGGITTLEEKSLGAVQKGGGAIIRGILDYAQRIQTKGLSILNAPGNDAISSTALAAAGAHIILFSTGRGTPLGFITPTLKISSNSELAKNKPHWIDFDAGQVIENANYEILSQSLFEKIIDIANGDKALNEINDIREFAIWKNGVTL